MKKLLKVINSAKGFTLIELLVVIGILGILAAALIATIDPFEQLKKAQDTNSKNTLVEFINANVRYYTTHNSFPWAAATSPCNSGTAPDGSANLTDEGLATCIDSLVADNELKASFATAQDILKTIYVNYDATNNQLVACFQPQSKSQQNDENTKYNSAGTEGTNPGNCTFDGSGNPSNLNAFCFWCSR